MTNIMDNIVLVPIVFVRKQLIARPRAREHGDDDDDAGYADGIVAISVFEPQARLHSRAQGKCEHRPLGIRL